MPQTNVIPDWKATYPNDAPAQKPGGVTVSTTLIANAVPNKPQPWTATTITAPYVAEPSEAAEEAVHEEQAPEDEEVHEDEEADEEENDENGHPKPRTTHRRGSQHRSRRR